MVNAACVLCARSVRAHCCQAHRASLSRLVHFLDENRGIIRAKVGDEVLGRLEATRKELIAAAESRSSSVPKPSKAIEATGAETTTVVVPARSEHSTFPATLPLQDTLWSRLSSAFLCSTRSSKVRWGLIVVIVILAILVAKRTALLALRRVARQSVPKQRIMVTL